MMVPSTVSRCDQMDYGDYEDRHDTTVNQMLVPRSHQEDATIVLNNLLKEYDKTLRPDIGGKAGGEPGDSNLRTVPYPLGSDPRNHRKGWGLVCDIWWHLVVRVENATLALFTWTNQKLKRMWVVVVGVRWLHLQNFYEGAIKPSWTGNGRMKVNHTGLILSEEKREDAEKDIKLFLMIGALILFQWYHFLLKGVSE